MKPEEILNAMEHIDADLIEAADGGSQQTLGNS